MASIATRSNNRREIQVTLDGKRYSIRLGKCTAKQAATVCHHVEQLMAQRATGHPAEMQTQRWLGEISDVVYDRVARTGLVPRRNKVRLGEWLDKCIQSKSKIDAPNTVSRRNQSKRHMLAHFAKERDIRTITAGDAEDYETHLKGLGLAEGTYRKLLADARQWMNAAVRHEIIHANPFEGVRVGSVATPHKAYVTEIDARKVMAELPDARMRLIFALARWGGLRTPSEHKLLRWADVDWARGRFTVHATKTGRSRVVPLFAEIAPLMREALEQAEDGEAMVLPGLSLNSAALRKVTLAAIRRAGLSPWPRLYHNLRASRQTDLEAQHPTHVVCAWMGNSQRIAVKHYLQVTDADYELAAKNAADCGGQHMPAAARTAATAPETR